ncbi:hypothetical protein HKBW3S44_00991 [Candidatus Hakubella thermalkaliphila]|uniref:Saccharopine dehydrogenase (NAD+, L-lysine forming) n=1 Tax=Candidatus Hakubella thermalkaliphila TaxID=2754717 RepID=A0A6V8Q311_9ACTN|nr:saccharopine dehydrogenase C-terminal domain-containing protein [Candidatus Hakubella thermalkaliphila]GFP37311.1 hypothetical protein HKBW3S44_00991 [Candidatus Hakubella thermalkaliphila]
MKAILIGVGGVGTVIARILAKTGKFEHIVLADVGDKHINELARGLGSGFSARLVDASSVDNLMEAVEGIDLVINATLPRYNLNIMDAALAARAHYLDLASQGPVHLPGIITIQDQIKEYDEKFKAIDRSAFLSTGIDPGATNVFARYLADQMDTVDDVLIRDADVSTVQGFKFALSFSPDTAIEECLEPYLSYENGRFVQGEPLSAQEEFTFPEPIGKQKVYYVSHEEVGTLPLHLGRQIKNCNFGYALPYELVNVLKVLQLLGLDGAEPVEVKGVKVAPRDVVTALLPTPLELSGKIKGYTCVGTLVRGTIGGEKVEKFMYSLESHEDAYLKFKTQGTSYQTAVPAAVAADLFAEGLIMQRGAFPAEVIDPKPFVEKLSQYGLNIKIEDRNPVQAGGH